jgi:septal ring factor EnvC (AmiA/AmiB activator)
MKNLKKDLQAVTKGLKALTRKTESLAKEVAKLEKAQAAAKRKPKAKAKTAKKYPAKKKATKLTATDQVVNIIKRSKKGADVSTLVKKTGLADKTIRNILFRAGKQRKIQRTGRGVYVGA